jgi:hypothetical protein
MDESTLEGWTPEITDARTLADVIDRAFDYRGDVTVVKHDGTELIGYLFNRNADVAVPFVQLFERGSGEPVTVPYADIRAVAFTGKDTAAGNSYAAWLRAREAARVTAKPAS